MTTANNTSKLLFGLSLLAQLAACSDLGVPAAPGAYLVTGSWRLQRIERAPDKPVYLPPSDVIRIDTYTPQGRYASTWNGSLIIGAQYEVTKQNSAFLMKMHIDYVGGGVMIATSEPMYWVEVKRDTLRLVSSDVFDDFPEVQVFVRVK